MAVWLIGNTTIRNPYRLPRGLRAIDAAGLFAPGGFMGAERARAIGQALVAAGLAEARTGDPAVLGAKWRTVAMKFGFVRGVLRADLAEAADWNRGAGELTDNGRRLVEAEDDEEFRSCLTAALAQYGVPSPLDRVAAPFPAPFFPLRFVLGVMKALEPRTGSGRLTVDEIKLVVQVSSPADGVGAVADRVVAMRHLIARGKADEVSAHAAAVAAASGVKPGTLRDYADTNYRHLVATEILAEDVAGGIVFAAGGADAVEELCGMPAAVQGAADYALALGGGWRPRRAAGRARRAPGRAPVQAAPGPAVEDLPDLPDPWRVDEYRRRREYALRDGEAPDEEREYAARQAHCLPDIAAALRGLAERRYRIELPGGGELAVPRAPGALGVYLEWSLWRLGCALGGGGQRPWTARGCTVGRDFLPLTASPESRPDACFEFGDRILALDGTIAVGPEAEACEGKAARLRIADRSRRGKLPVFGILAAPEIGFAAADELLVGHHYRRGVAVPTRVVPLTLAQLATVCDALAGSRAPADSLFALLEDCCEARQIDTPRGWLERIDAKVRRSVERLGRGEDAVPRRAAERSPFSGTARYAAAVAAAGQRRADPWHVHGLDSRRERT